MCRPLHRVTPSRSAPEQPAAMDTQFFPGVELISRRNLVFFLALTVLWTPVTIGTAAEPAPKAAPVASPSSPSKDDYYEMYKVLIDTMDQVDRNYVKEIDRRELIEAAIKGVIGKLDPYSSYIGPEELSHFRTAVENEFGGIGIQISTDDGDLTVLSPIVRHARLSRRPAGRRPDRRDRRQEHRRPFARTRPSSGLRAKREAQVTLTVSTPASATKRRKSPSPANESTSIPCWATAARPTTPGTSCSIRKQRIGYVRVTAFSRETADDLRKALRAIAGAEPPRPDPRSAFQSRRAAQLGH